MLTIGSYLEPHPDKGDGEDTFFISQDLNCISVFDGVGSWVDEGVNPRDYPLALSEGVKIKYEEGVRDPLELLAFAYERASTVTGSSTATIAVLNGEKLKVSHLGDCTLMVIRSLRCFFRSEEQQMEFNAPYQLGTNSFIHPTWSLSYDIELENGDWIILGSDGLFDNLYEGDVINCFKKRKGKVLTPQKISETLVKLALEVAYDAKAKTPFSDHAREAGYTFKGGKLDDITAIVSLYQHQ